MSKRALPVLTTAEPKKKTMLPEVLPDPRARRERAAESPRERTLARLKGLRAAAAAAESEGDPSAPASLSGADRARP